MQLHPLQYEFGNVTVFSSLLKVQTSLQPRHIHGTEQAPSHLYIIIIVMTMIIISLSWSFPESQHTSSIWNHKDIGSFLFSLGCSICCCSRLQLHWQEKGVSKLPYSIPIIPTADSDTGVQPGAGPKIHFRCKDINIPNHSASCHINSS